MNDGRKAKPEKKLGEVVSDSDLGWKKVKEN